MLSCCPAISTEKSQRRATVFVKGSKAPYAVLRLTAVVRRVWSIPAEIDLGILNRQRSIKRSILILAAGLPDASLSDLQIPVGLLDYAVKSNQLLLNEQLRDRQPDRVLCNLEIEWNGSGRTLGTFSHAIVVKTNVEEFPQIVIPVKGRVVGDVDVRPAFIAFGRVRSGESVRRTAEFKWEYDNAPFPKVFAARATQDSATATVSCGTSEGQQQVEIQCVFCAPHVEESQQISGTLSVDWDGQEHLQIPYQALVTP